MFWWLVLARNMTGPLAIAESKRLQSSRLPFTASPKMLPGELFPQFAMPTVFHGHGEEFFSPTAQVRTCGG
jgi:hypothetical protein